DEYQDLNLAQERLVELVADAKGELCVVGDDDQSNYRFRGGSRARLERFRTNFPGAETVQLGRNLRSTGRIVRAAAAVVEHDTDRISKVLSARAELGPAVELWECEDGTAEASAIAAE